MKKPNILLQGVKQLGNAVKSLASGMVISPSTFRSDDNGYWYFLDGAGSSFTYTGCMDAIAAYERCAPYAAVINQKVRTFTNGRLWVMDDKNKEAKGRDADKLRRLLRNPNPMQSGSQFRAQGYAYTQLFGWNLVMVVKPFGYKDNIDASALWNVPPHLVDIEETRKLFYQTGKEGIIKSIVLNWDGARVSLPVEDCYIITDLVPPIGDMIFPQSRVKPLQYAIANIIGAYESRNEIINHRGARGIITNRGSDAAGLVPIPQSEKDALENHFKGRYGMRHGMIQFIITSAMVDYVPIGQKVDEMKLFEEVEADRKEICDGYGVPPDLLSQEKGSTFNNKQESEKKLYTGTIIPESENYDNQLNRLFDTEKYSLRIEYDYSHVPILQEDKKAQAQAKKELATAVVNMYKNRFITLNRAREIMEEDTVPGDDNYFEGDPNNNNDGQQNNQSGNGGEEEGEEETQS